MAWIHTIPPEEAKGPLARLYEAIAANRGAVADVHQAQSLNPRALAAHLELYKAVVFQRSSLSRIARERIAVVVSAENRCTYCVAHHGETARKLGDDAAVIEALGWGVLPDHLPAAERALLSWARAAAAEPWSPGADGVESLRAHGFDDRAILDAVLTVGYFSFVNRIVLLLGASLEPDYSRMCGPEAPPSDGR